MNQIVSGIRRAGAVAGFGLLMALPAGAEEGIQSLESIRETAESFVRAQMPQGDATDITVGPLDARLRLAACSEPLQALLTPGTVLRARATVGVACRGSKSWTVYVPVLIESNISVLVLKQAATRGARLTTDNVEVQTRKVVGGDVSYLTSVKELTGRTIKRPLPAGTVLTADFFTDDVLVRRGQEVTLLASAGGFEIRAPGRAMSDAGASGRIKVQNLSSLRVVEGVVESANVIRVTP